MSLQGRYTPRPSATPLKRGLSRSRPWSHDPEPGTSFGCGPAALCLILLVVLVLTGCGYHFAGQGSPFASELKTIAIPIFENQTAETGFESLITTQLVSQFSSRGRLRVASMEKADLILEGRIAAINARDVAFTGSYLGIERRVAVTLAARVVARDGRRLWEGQNIVKEEGYRIDTNPITTEANKRAALEKMARDIAEIVYFRIFEDF
ncbi:MAG: LptE family protein [Pseudomonadota bacterium]